MFIIKTKSEYIGPFETSEDLTQYSRWMFEDHEVYTLVSPIDAALAEHAKPGKWCPECEDIHCQPGKGHQYNEDDYCIYCGAGGRA